MKDIKKPQWWPENPFVKAETLKDKMPILGGMTKMMRPLFKDLIDARDQKILQAMQKEGLLK